jgi:hypothetical protein
MGSGPQVDLVGLHHARVGNIGLTGLINSSAMPGANPEKL